jgi:hypothetical protein
MRIWREEIPKTYLTIETFSYKKNMLQFSPLPPCNISVYTVQVLKFCILDESFNQCCGAGPYLCGSGSIKRFLKVNSTEIVIFKVNFKFYFEKFRVFVITILHTRLRSRAKNFGSGSGFRKKLMLHRLRLCNTDFKA